MFEADNFDSVGGVVDTNGFSNQFDDLEKRISKVEAVFAYLKSKSNGESTSIAGGSRNTKNKE